MGYRVVYEELHSDNNFHRDCSLKIRSMVAVSFLVFSIIVRLIWPEGTSMLQSCFLPNECSVTEEAFSVLITDIKNGTTLEDAVWAFCSSIIDEAKTY